ncbi:MAG: hypothetical protein GF384_01590 [Elusimicrobia bacterium]|nr:hypothetical protein [Elusimicrobiota bacterium]
MKCPRCGLENPETTQRCDCGFDFYKKTIEKAYFTQKLPKEFIVYFSLVMIGQIVTGLFLIYKGKYSYLVHAVIYAVVFLWLYWNLIKKKEWARLILIIYTFPFGLLLGLSKEASLYCLQEKNK